MNASEVYDAGIDSLARGLHDWIVADWTDGPLSWRSFFPVPRELPVQGWKIHVSAAAHESSALLASVCRSLLDCRLAFKLPRRLADLVFLNSGDAGIELLGKIVTVYPRDDASLRNAIEILDAAWPSTRGPEVQTDLHLRPRSAVSLRYGVFGSASVHTSSTGMLSFGLVDAHGVLTCDTRRTDGQQWPHAPLAPLEVCPPEPHPVRIHHVVTIDGIPFLPLAQLADTPRARTFLGADTASLQTLVLKVGRRGVAGDSTGADISALLEREFRVLRMLQTDHDLAPRALGWSNESGWPALLTEDFRGENLSELRREELISCLPGLAEALARLHARGIVHGDIKLENAVRRNPGVGLIDFELAAFEGAAARRGGTRGHRAPEVQAGAPAAPARDIFALGACVAQAVLGVPVALLPEGRERLAALLRNEGQAQAAECVTWLMHPDASLRPSAAAAAQALRSNAPCWAAPRSGNRRPTRSPERRWCLRASVDAGMSVSSFSTDRHAGSGWRNAHFMRSFECEGINLGAAGIILGLLTIDRAAARRDFEYQAARGAAWLSGRLAETGCAGFFTGNAGVAVALAAAGLRFCDGNALVASARRFEAACLDDREIDLFSGRAGVVWAASFLKELLGDSAPLDRVAPLARDLLGSARLDAGIPTWQRGSTQGVSYLGCAHGSAGIAMALASWAHNTGDAATLDLARETFRAIFRHARTPDGRAIRIRLDGDKHHAVGNWCHGVAGCLWALLQAFGDDPQLGDEIDAAVDCLAKAPSVGTATYCHGLAGQLELWRMLSTVPRFSALGRARSAQAVRALRHMRRLEEGRCCWSSDDPDIVTPDLWIGFLGPASALAMHAARCTAPLLSPSWVARLGGMQPASRGVL